MIPYERGAWIRLLFSTTGSMSRAVLGKLALFTALAAAITVADQVFELPVRLPMGFHEVAGIVIGLILAFRTNTAYARFWEGRSLWGGIVNSSRNLARIVSVHAGLDAAESREFRIWIVAFDQTARCRLRGQHEVHELVDLISADDYAAMLASPHPALFCSEQLSRRVSEYALRGTLDPIMATVAEHEINNLVNCLGGSEKILRTPTPLGYIVLMERAVYLYLGTLPAALLVRLGWLTPLVTAGVAYLVLMIETMGNELDNPFGLDGPDIPLDQICSNITFDILGVGKEPRIGPEKGVGKVEL